MGDSNYKILYVDDEKDNLEVFESMFWRKYKIFLADSAEAGLEVLKNEEIHLILSDHRMPEITGVEFLEKVVSKYPEPLRILITGYGDYETVANAINKGKIFHFLTKPWNPPELENIISKALEVVRLKEENKLLLLSLQHSNKKLELLNKELEEKNVELKNMIGKLENN